MKRILFLSPYPLAKVGSQRFRFEQYFDILTSNGFLYSIDSFFSRRGWTSFRSGSWPRKMFAILAGYFSRIGTLLHVHRYDFIFIHREATPLGPPIVEWIICKILHKPIIYDFDDAIWMTDNVSESALQKLLKWRKKVKQICKWSYKVSAGNEYLASYAQQVNHKVIIIPTTIDTEKVHNPRLFPAKEQLKMRNGINGVTINWTGSRTTLKYLEDLADVLKQLEQENPSLTFIVIADEAPSLPIKNLIFKQWSAETEISDLLLADIGIMPLPDDEWTKGKCGFKALQYMALEIPAVASPVGVNTRIIQHKQNGLLCTSTQEWLESLRLLISESEARLRLGREGRNTVIQAYSKESNTSIFLSLFQ